ncbi:MAG: hypothetical protein ACXWWE_01015, partial [Nitrospira sp.]
APSSGSLHTTWRALMEKDVRDSFERIENAVEDLGKAIKTAMDELSTEIMNADHGVETKVDRILKLLEGEK